MTTAEIRTLLNLQEWDVVKASNLYDKNIKHPEIWLFVFVNDRYMPYLLT
jgi:hypothetical protein